MPTTPSKWACARVEESEDSGQLENISQTIRSAYLFYVRPEPVFLFGPYRFGQGEV